MEPTNIPRWFWIAIGAVVVITIIANIYCKNKAVENKSNIATNLNGQRSTLSDSLYDIQNLTI